jgi:hypothetical protein
VAAGQDVTFAAAGAATDVFAPAVADVVSGNTAAVGVADTDGCNVAVAAEGAVSGDFAALTADVVVVVGQAVSATTTDDSSGQ